VTRLYDNARRHDDRSCFCLDCDWFLYRLGTITYRLYLTLRVSSAIDILFTQTEALDECNYRSDSNGGLGSPLGVFSHQKP